MRNRKKFIELMKEKAQAVSAVCADVAGPEAALAYVLELCDKKEACQLLAAGCEAGLSEPAKQLCDGKQAKVIAAPGLSDELYASLAKACADKGFLCVKEGLRGYLSGIDIGFGVADFGIAETGTMVLRSMSEEVRLSTMISEIHVALLPTSKIRHSAFDLEKELAALTRETPCYTAFVTGASRTADIERVLALGVHGPLELHILFWED